MVYRVSFPPLSPLFYRPYSHTTHQQIDMQATHNTQLHQLTNPTCTYISTSHMYVPSPADLPNGLQPPRRSKSAIYIHAYIHTYIEVTVTIQGLVMSTLLVPKSTTGKNERKKISRKSPPLPIKLTYYPSPSHPPPAAPPPPLRPRPNRTSVILNGKISATYTFA